MHAGNHENCGRDSSRNLRGIPIAGVLKQDLLILDSAGRTSFRRLVPLVRLSDGPSIVRPGFFIVDRLPDGKPIGQSQRREDLLRTPLAD
jgi:hypothetical protein